MTHFDLGRSDIAQIQHRQRHSSHLQRVQMMLVAAGLTSLGIVGVAGALLTQLF